MGEISSGSDLFNELAYEFAERYRRGERPSLHEYIERYPELADEIRELFPMLAMMERAGSEADPPRGLAAEPSRRDAAIPERLGDYRILREIGRGGMGVVYEAVQESLGRHVALKVLSPDRTAGAVALARFRREARTAALLHHTNIVPVFGVGEHEGVPYYAMQYIRGRGLDAVLREVAAMRRGSGAREGADSLPAGLATGLVTGRYSDLSVAVGPAGGVPPSTSEPDGSTRCEADAPGAAGGERPRSGSSGLGGAESPYYREVARMARQAAEALAYAHAHGVVHRDVKPSNLLLDVQGTVWVTDFGLAKAEDSDELTRPGDVVGTLRYLAPERFAGRADARSDIYGLGMTLYEMLVLEPAFRASHRVRLMHAILHEEPKRPRELDPGIPRDLETIVLKAIAKDPADRFAEAGAMAAELGRFIEGRPIRSRRLSLAERVWRWSRRNPALAASSLLASVLAVLLVIGSALSAWVYREQRDAVTKAKQDTEASRDRAMTAERQTAASRDRALAAERESKAELVRSLVQQARAERRSGRPGRRAAALEALGRAARVAREVGASTEDLALLRDEVITALALDDVRLVGSWPGLDPEPRRAGYAFEADRYVVVGGDRAIHVHRLSDRSEARVLGADRPSFREWPSLSADGRFLHTWSETQLELWDLERGEIPVAWPADALGVAFRPDGRQVAVARENSELRVYDLPAMTESARHRMEFDLSVLRRQYAWMALSGDGRRLALVGVRSGSAHGYVLDVASGRVVREIPIPTGPDHGVVALDHAGTVVAFGHGRAITVYDVADGGMLARLQGHQSGGLGLLFQPGGGLLATTGWDGTTRLWDPIRGRPLAVLPVGGRGWSRDGSRLAVFRGQELFAEQIEGGVGLRMIDGRRLGGPPGAVQFGPTGAAYSPDGRLIALPFRLDGVRIVRASDGRGLARLPVGFCDVVQFLPDGGLVTYSNRGVCRWPIHRLGDGALAMGPPEPLALIEQPGHWVPNGLAVAGGRVAVTREYGRPGALLLDPDRPWRRAWLVPHPNPAGVAISPDGRWAATGSRAQAPVGRRVRVWSAADGELVAQLEAGNAHVAFSPDGRWLGVGGSLKYRFYRVGTWAPGAEVEHGGEGGLLPLSFHPGGRVAATITDSSRTVVRLVEVETGRAIAALEPPDPAPIHAMAFSPDGRHLAVTQSDQRVQIWDLVPIRRELDALGLAAGIPDIFGGATAGDDPAVERIEVEGADRAGLMRLAIRQVLHEAWIGFRALWAPRLDDAEERLGRAERWIGLGHWRLAAADCRAILARRPDSLPAASSLVRCLLNDPGGGAPSEAVRWARAAVARRPDAVDFHMMLGAALYRAGSFVEAVAELEAYLPRYQEGAGFGLLYLAMCRQRMGQAAAARAALTEALRWRDAKPAFSPADLPVFRGLLREAESVAAEELPDLPPDVFAR